MLCMLNYEFKKFKRVKKAWGGHKKKKRCKYIHILPEGQMLLFEIANASIWDQ